MSWNTTARRRAHFESLEQRQLLAGDVLVNVVAGNLIVQGDALDNHIAITAGAEDGTLLITGLDGTTVHLEDQAPGTSVTVEVRDAARIDLGAGNDTIELTDANLRGGVSIRTGEGNDNVTVDATDVVEAAAAAGTLEDDDFIGIRGALRISTDGGVDTVVIDDAAVHGSVHINAGADHDSVTLGDGVEVAPPVSFGGDSNGTGDNGGLLGRLRMRGGANIDLGDGNDVLNINQVSARLHAFVDAGAGDDQVNVLDSSLRGLTVLGDEGIDHVRVEGLQANHLSVHGGDDGDTVEVIDSAFSSLWVALGSGDDTLATTNVEAKFAVLLGGPGQDTFNQLGVDEFMFDIVNGFELPELIVSPIGRLQPFGRAVG